ncbi:MAG TPA: site-specific DNA-methyltransferase [Spirosoma sp.]|nr:site-specific DNA-methyltransferase [Spirosoma sp.]
MEWRKYNPTVAGRSWAVPNVTVEALVGKEKCIEMGVLAKLDLLYENNYLVFSKNGIPSVKRYLDNSKGNIVANFWNDLPNIQSQSKERIGYPTQKPEALLERIIIMASNEGDVVLDPFVGGGTTVAVADKLHRRWIGIDQSVQAIKVTELRLYNQADLFTQPFLTKLHKYDYDTLRYKDAFQFETFMVTTFGGRPNTRQRGDLGLDGRTPDNIPIQVKRSDNIGRNVVDNFLSAIQRYDKRLFDQNRAEGKPAGFIIAFSFGKGAIEEVARLKNSENVIIKLVRVEDIVPIAKKPTLRVTLTDQGKDRNGGAAKVLHSISFQAIGESAVGVEFYSWDFDYKDTGGRPDTSFKAEVLLDKSGFQTWKFKPGLHYVAVKVVDNDGLESVEVLKLKVNGNVERQP